MPYHPKPSPYSQAAPTHWVADELRSVGDIVNDVELVAVSFNLEGESLGSTLYFNGQKWVPTDAVKVDPLGSVELYHNGGLRLQTRSEGFQSLSGTGGIWAGVGIRTAARGELFISSNSVNAASDIHFRSGQSGMGSDTDVRWTISDRGLSDGTLLVYQSPAHGTGFRIMIECIANEGVGLRYNNVERMRTHLQDGRGGIRLNGSGPMIVSGSGSPESVVTAPVGSIYLRTDSATTLYVKQTGTGNTGWVAK
jgi:hypothetical protein